MGSRSSSNSVEAGNVGSRLDDSRLDDKYICLLVLLTIRTRENDFIPWLAENGGVHTLEQSDLRKRCLRTLTLQVPPRASFTASTFRSVWSANESLLAISDDNRTHGLKKGRSRLPSGLKSGCRCGKSADTGQTGRRMYDWSGSSPGHPDGR